MSLLRVLLHTPSPEPGKPPAKEDDKGEDRLCSSEQVKPVAGATGRNLRPPNPLTHVAV